MSDLDFSNASLDDFKSAGDQVQESATTETVDKAPESAQAAPEATTTETPAKAESNEFQFKDDFIKGVVEFYEKTGDITPYLQAKSVDFTKMSDEEIMRRELRDQYSELSDKAFDKLYKQEVTDKFKLDSDEWGEDESELGRELLKLQASKSREKFLDWQKNFQAPDPVGADDNSAELLRQFEEGVRNHEITRSILDAKKISIKSGDGEFQYEVPNADSLVDMTVNNDKFFSQFAQAEGQLDYNKWYKTVAYSQNPEMFEKALINFGKTQGRTEVTREIKNPSTSPVGDVPTEGSGDFQTGLLNAFLSRGVSK